MSNLDPSDETLAGRVARGDVAAFAMLYDRYAQRVFAWAAHVVGTAEAEDVVQEVFARLWSKAAQFDAQRARFAWWFVAVARHPPQGTGNCAACHTASNKDRDFTFRAWSLPFTAARWAQAPLPGTGEVSLNRMAFFPNVLTVKTGTTVKWVNSIVDQLDHTVNANDNSFSSQVLKPGESFSQTFAKPGSYMYFCALHPEQMRARIDVKD